MEDLGTEASHPEPVCGEPGYCPCATPRLVAMSRSPVPVQGPVSSESLPHFLRMRRCCLMANVVPTLSLSRCCIESRGVPVLVSGTEIPNTGHEGTGSCPWVFFNNWESRNKIPGKCAVIPVTCTVPRSVTNAPMFRERCIPWPWGSNYYN